jgi:hypothetical protein
VFARLDVLDGLDQPRLNIFGRAVATDAIKDRFRMHVIVTPASTASVVVINAVLEGMSSYFDDGKLVYTF